MSVCRYCGVAFAWGNADGKWVPLVPVGDEGELIRDYQDENGALRASHSQICLRVGGPTVRISKLAKNVPAEDVIGLKPVKSKRQRKKGTQSGNS